MTALWQYPVLTLSIHVYQNILSLNKKGHFPTLWCGQNKFDEKIGFFPYLYILVSQSIHNFHLLIEIWCVPPPPSPIIMTRDITSKKSQIHDNLFCECLTTAAQVVSYQHQVQTNTKGKVKVLKSIQKKYSTKSLQIFDNCLSADCCRTDQTNKCKNAEEALLDSWQQLSIKYANSTFSSFKRDLIFTNCIYLMLEHTISSISQVVIHVQPYASF